MKINEQKLMPALNQLFMTVHLLWNEQDPGVPLGPWFRGFNKCWLGTAMFLVRFCITSIRRGKALMPA